MNVARIVCYKSWLGVNLGVSLVYGDDDDLGTCSSLFSSSSRPRVGGRKENLTVITG